MSYVGMRAPRRLHAKVLATQFEHRTTVKYQQAGGKPVGDTTCDGTGKI